MVKHEHPKNSEEVLLLENYKVVCGGTNQTETRESTGVYYQQQKRRKSKDIH